MPIYEQRLQHDLTQMMSLVQEMCEQVAVAVDHGVEVLISRDENLANLTILADQGINHLRTQIHGKCHAFFVRHFPSGHHLRRVSSILSFIDELERIGDYAVTLARESVHLSKPLGEPFRTDIVAIAASSRGVLQQAIQAFIDDDAALATSTMDLARQVEEEVGRVINSFIHAVEIWNGNCTGCVDLRAVFYMLERISNRSMNICEHATYSATGAVKPDKVFQIFFLDVTNSCQSQIAEAIARRDFPKTARYRSAGLKPASAIDPRLRAFLKQQKLDLTGMQPKRFAPDEEDLSGNNQIVISLEGPVRNYLPEVPFHMVVLQWNVDRLPPELENDAAQERLAAMFEQIATRVGDLVALLQGKGSI